MEGACKEYRVFGPPGTGKTTYLAQKIAEAKSIYGGRAVFVGSFTKAAAEEIASRGGVQGAVVGTIHAHCYRAMGSPKVASVQEFLGGKPGHVDVDDPYGEMEGGDSRELLEINRLRNLMIPVDRWQSELRNVYRRWEGYKRKTGSVDFTDMLEYGLREMEEAPGCPAVGFIDEAQDLTPLQLAVVRKWGQKMNHLILVGDEDQTLYEFLGASPMVFIGENLPESRVMVLAQSHRVPELPHRVAQDIIGKVKTRHPKDYRPTGERGEVRKIRVHYEKPQSLIEEIEADVARGMKVMLLAPTRRTLFPYLTEMRARGLAFSNPYRPAAGDWNPMRGNASLFMDFLRFDSAVWGSEARPWWSVDEFLNWSRKLKKRDSGVFPGLIGMDEATARATFPTGQVTWADLFPSDSELGVELAFGDVRTRIDWFLRSVDSATTKAISGLPLAIYNKNPRLLRERDRVIVGTIHSVKGGEADSVYVLTQLTKAHKAESMDTLRRLFYVAVTRTRNKLTICESAVRCFDFAPQIRLP